MKSSFIVSFAAPTFLSLTNPSGMVFSSSCLFAFAFPVFVVSILPSSRDGREECNLPLSASLAAFSLAREAIVSEAVTLYDGLEGSPSGAPPPGPKMGILRSARTSAQVSFECRAGRMVSIDQFDYYSSTHHSFYLYLIKVDEVGEGTLCLTSSYI